MSRVLRTGIDQVTCSYAQHVTNAKSGKGWARGVDIVKQHGQTDDIIAHTGGRVIKAMTGQVNGKNDPEGMGYGNYFTK